MNIFKVLSSGDGRLKEPNLSAFLGYLFNPKEDHGLNGLFLQKVLEGFLNLYDQENPLKKLFSHLDTDSADLHILDLSIQSRFNVDVVLEKAVKKKNENEEESKQIIDILIKITERSKTGDKKEDVSYLFECETPIALILIENKINPGWKESQLIDQYQFSLDYLPSEIIKKDWERWRDNICTILICPYEKDIEHRFEGFKENKYGNKRAIYLPWKDEAYSIKSILQKILKQNLDGSISPIQNYTADTLRALIEFIGSDFSSDADDQQRGGKQTKEFIEYDTLEEAIASGSGNFSSMSLDMQEWIRQLNKKLLSIQGVRLHYSRQRIAAEFEARRNWNINFGNAGGYKIQYKSETGPLNPDDKPLRQHWYENNNINITDRQAIDVALRYLENVIKK